MPMERGTKIIIDIIGSKTNPAELLRHYHAKMKAGKEEVKKA